MPINPCPGGFRASYLFSLSVLSVSSVAIVFGSIVAVGRPFWQGDRSEATKGSRALAEGGGQSRALRVACGGASGGKSGHGAAAGDADADADAAATAAAAAAASEAGGVTALNVKSEITDDNNFVR